MALQLSIYVTYYGLISQDKVLVVKISIPKLLENSLHGYPARLRSAENVILGVGPESKNRPSCRYQHLVLALDPSTYSSCGDSNVWRFCHEQSVSFDVFWSQRYQTDTKRSNPFGTIPFSLAPRPASRRFPRRWMVGSSSAEDLVCSSCACRFYRFSRFFLLF